MAKSRYEKEYVCTRCGATVDDRDKLTVKKVEFRAMGSGGRTFRSRVIGWLCPDCLRADGDWNREPYTDPAEAEASVTTGQLTVPGT